MKIVYGVCSWGLGHATRSLPIIRKLIDEKNDLTIISSGRSLDLLKKELGNGNKYFDIPDYPVLISENTRQFVVKSFVYWPAFIKRMESGLQKLKKILDKLLLPFDDGLAEKEWNWKPEYGLERIVGDFLEELRTRPECYA